MQLYPNSATAFIAALLQDELALSKLRLFQDSLLSPSIATTRAELIAAEATYTGYTAGGEVLTAWFPPLNNPIGGSSIDSPKVQFDAATPFTVSNTIGGFWVETAGTDVIVIGMFENPIPIGAAGQGFPLSVSLIFPN